MAYSVNEIGRNILSVVAGVLIAVIIILPVAVFVAFMSFSDSSIPRSQEILIDLLLISGAVFGLIIGGYTTAKVSTRKDIVHGIITGLVLTFLLLVVNDFEFNWQMPDRGIAYFCIIPVVLIGLFIGIKKKKKLQ